MIYAAVYSHFASRKLKSVANLSEKQKWMINMCIIKDEGTEWNFLISKKLHEVWQ